MRRAARRIDVRPGRAPFPLLLITGLALLSAPTGLDLVTTAGEPPSELTPGGPFDVGTVVVLLEDADREEVWTARVGDARRLLVQVFYPARNDGSRRAAYIPEAAAMLENLERYGFETLPPPVTIAALENAPPRRAGRPFPVVLYSHGMNAARWAGTNLAQELASRGVVVVTIDHTYWGLGHAFPDGVGVSIDDSMIARDTLTSEEITSLMAEGVRVFAADQAFVAERLRSLARKGPRPTRKVLRALDLRSMIVMGHSMGGMAAELSCIDVVVVAGCVNLDGPYYGDALVGTLPFPVEKPFLLVRSEQFMRSGADGVAAAPEALGEFLDAYDRRWKTPRMYVVDGSRHNSFNDLPIIAGWEYSEAAGALQRDVAQVVVGFVRTALDADRRALPSELESVPDSWRLLGRAGAADPEDR